VCVRVRVRVQVNGMIGAFYDDFMSAVAKGRAMSKEAVRAVAKGRVWSGSQAMEVRGVWGSRTAADYSIKPSCCIDPVLQACFCGWD
jgi:ClpP class serine protease